MLHSLHEYDVLVSEKIFNILEHEIRNAPTHPAGPQQDLAYLQKLTIEHSKKIRAYLVYLAANFFNEKLEAYLADDMLTIAAALEIFHTAVLIHDDIMDASRQRRGMDTFHIYGTKKYHAEQLGLSLAIDFGDTGLFLSLYVLTRLNLPEKVKGQLIAQFTRIAIDLSYGQRQDLFLDIAHTKTVGFDELIAICNMKTGIYTFLLPLQLGLIASGHPAKIQSVHDFAYHAGIVYQLTDDLIDIASTKTGKTACNDLKEGKMNSINMLLLQKTHGDDRKYIQAVLQKEAKVNTQKVRAIAERNGVYIAQQEIIAEHVRAALQSLRDLDGNTEAAKTLHRLLLQIQHRDS